MKNFTNNFKQFTSRLSARWLIMALMLLVGTSSAWAATRTYNGTEKLYVSDPGDNWWNNDGAYTAAYFYGSNGSAWTNAKQINGVIALNIPAGTWTHVIMVRLNNSTPNWGNKISDNQTGDITLPTTGDYIKGFKKGSTSATWSTYTPPCDPPTLTLTTTSATVNKGETVNLTTRSGATASNSGTIEWSTSTTGSPVIDANVTISATKTYYAKAVKDGCKSASQSFKITAACTKDFYLVGQGSFFGSDWTTGQDANKLDCDLNTLTKTYTNKTVAANTKVEYKITGANGWKDAEYPTSGNASFTIPTAGTYNITFTAKTNGTSITETPTVTWELSCTTPKASHLTYTDPQYTYDGTAKTAEVKWADDDTNAGITIKYGSNNTTAPKNAGNYDLKVSTVAHGDLCASQEDISLGTFTISQKTPDVNDFVYTDQTVTYDGNAQTANVTWKQGYDKTGAITITYKQGNEVKDPMNAGTYEVWVTSAASDNFNATEFEIKKGTLTINLAEITDVPNNFQLSKTSYNYGEEAKPEVSLKQSSTLIQAGLGAITTKYYNSSDQEVANPTAVGTYTVKITMTAGNGYSAITEPTVVGTFEITCYKPINPTLSKTDVTRCNGEPKTRGTITITNYAQYPEGCVFYLDGNIVTPTNEGVIENVYFPTVDSKTYTVKVINTCGSTIQESDETQIAIKATDAAPSIGDFEIKYNVSSVCSGTIVQLEATHVNGATYAWYKGNSQDAIEGATDRTYSPSITENSTYRVTVTKTSNGCPTTKEAITGTITAIPQADAPQITPNYMTVCGSEAFELPNIDGVTWSLGGKPTTGSQPGIANNTDEAIIKTFKAVKEVDGCPSAPADYTVTVNPTPVITGGSVAQPGKKNAITLNLQGNLVADWEISGGDIDKAQGNSIQFSAETNGTYTITATTKEDCSATHVVNVADAFYVYMRQPKKGETAYNNFYYPTQNPTQGGDLFYKEYASIPPAEGYTDYNTGGVAHDIIFTDCDGYVWYGFKASDKLVDGTNYFTVHAPNLGGIGGYYTHTYLTKPGAMTSDIYYTMNENASGSSQGWYITKASAPYSGPVVHASGNDFSFNKNNFADFVALYVTDCSGKEIDYYQWQYSQTENGKYDDYSSVCTYVGKKSEQGDAGKTNNIRPNVAGWYRCTATYKDGSSLTSAAKQVTATSGTSYSFTSDLPIIMVNTNGYGFPSCDGLSGTASKNADVIKAKISVDVKIKLGNDIVYDRKARMNYRGSSSLNFVKKSYAFCPGKADCVEDKGRVDYVKTEKLNMLNVGSAVDKDWVLYAAAADPSIMRNRLMFDTFRDMTGTWSVQSRYVELIVDGEYKGIYVFMDKITNNANRVNINDEDGFIVKFDKTDLVDRYEGSGDKKTFKSLYSGKDGSGTYDTQIDQRFEIEYPEMEDVEEEEAGKWAKTVNKIKSMFNNFETQLKAGNYAEVQKIIDYNSWADWFIITEFAKNMDAYRASNLFVYNGDKIEARPLWDQELSFKNYCATLCDDYSCDNAEGLLIRTSKIYDEGESCSAPFWFTGKYVSGRGTEAIGGSQQFAGYLLGDPCFVQTIKDRWNEHKGKALSAESLNAKLERYTNEMATALDREKSIWKSEGGKLSRETCQCSYNGTTGYSDIKISDSKGDITEWINARPSELEEALKDEIGTGLSISFSEENINTTPWEPVVLQVHNESGYHYTLTYTDNALDQQAGIIIEKNGDTYKYNIPRPANWGTGNEDTEGERADIVYGLKATLQMDSSNVVCGSQAEVPFDEATITLQDELNEDCVQP